MRKQQQQMVHLSIGMQGTGVCVTLLSVPSRIIISSRRSSSSNRRSSSSRRKQYRSSERKLPSSSSMGSRSTPLTSSRSISSSNSLMPRHILVGTLFCHQLGGQSQQLKLSSWHSASDLKNTIRISAADSDAAQHIRRPLAEQQLMPSPSSVTTAAAQPKNSQVVTSAAA